MQNDIKFAQISNPKSPFSVVTLGSESWTLKKADLSRIDAFKTWSYRRVLRVSRKERSQMTRCWKKLGHV